MTVTAIVQRRRSNSNQASVYVHALPQRDVINLGAIPTPIQLDRVVYQPYYGRLIPTGIFATKTISNFYNPRVGHVRLQCEIHALFFLVRHNSFDSYGKQKKVM